MNTFLKIFLENLTIQKTIWKATFHMGEVIHKDALGNALGKVPKAAFGIKG